MPGMIDVARKAGVKVEVVQDVFEELLRRISIGEKVRIKGFGTFERKVYAGRTLHTPVVAGGVVTFPDSYAIKFHQSQLAKQRLNAKKKPDKAKSAEKQKAKPPKSEAQAKQKTKKSPSAPPKRKVKPRKAEASAEE